MKKILSILMALVLTITLSAQKTQYYDLIIQKTTPLLHLYGSGGIINWNNGDLLLTHTSNTLTLTGGDLLLSSTYSLGIGATTPLHKLVVAGAGANNRNIFNFVNTDLNKNRTSTTQARDTSSLNMWFSVGGSPLLTMMDKNGGVLFRADSIGFGIGTASPLTKLSVISSTTTNLNAFNFVQSTLNKRRDTFAQATDTSSVNLSFSATGSPTFKVTGKTAVNLLTIDSSAIKSALGITLSGTDALTLSGTATVWDDLMFPFSVGHQGNNTYPPFNADSLYFAFAVDSAGGDAQFMNFIIQFPHSWSTGTSIHPHIHYKQTAPAGATPVFIMKYKWYGIGATTKKGWSWRKLTVASDTIRNTHQLIETATPIVGSAITTVSSIMVCQIYLYSLATGTTECDAWQFDIHIEKNKLGSRDETVE